jgi:rare lipoprotein A
MNFPLRILVVALVLSVALIGVTSAAAQDDFPEIRVHEVGEALRYHVPSGVTSSGELYDARRLTVAHATLPFGALVEVVFRRRSVMARVNDRDTGGALVRVSERAAEELGLPPGGGTVEVRLDPDEAAFLRAEVQRQRARVPATSPRPRAKAAPAGPARFTVQMASFSDESRAHAHARRFRGAWVQPVSLDGSTIYRVYYGIYPSREAAARGVAVLRLEGGDGFVKQLGPTEPQVVSAVEGGRAAFDAGVIEPASPPVAVQLASAAPAPQAVTRGWCAPRGSA